MGGRATLPRFWIMVYNRLGLFEICFTPPPTADATPLSLPQVFLGTQVVEQALAPILEARRSCLLPAAADHLQTSSETRPRVEA